jgi:hypothetical protein
MIKSTQLRFTLFITACLIVAGCTTTGKQTGYLDHYSKLHQGKYLAGFWADQTLIRQGNYEMIRIAAININQIQQQREVLPSDIRNWLQGSLMTQLRELGVSDHFTFDADTAHDAVLKLSVTDMTPGSPAARFWAAEFGVGHAKVQVEGMVKDAATGKTLALLSERKRSSGAVGMKDVGGDAGASLIRGMVRRTAKNIVSEISATFDFR